MVSHRVCRKVSGALHEETSYGPTGLKDENGQAIYAYRKRLEELTIPMVDAIVDNVVRDILRRRLVEKGVDLHVTSKKIPGEVWKEPLYMRCTSSDKRVPIKKVRIREVMNHAIALCDETGRAYRAVKPGSNHHIEVFEYVDEKGRTRRDGRVITTFEAVQRSRRGEPVVRRDYQDGRRFVSSAAINETFMLQLEEGAEQLFRVQKISSNQQIFFRHHTFGGELHGSKGISKYPNTLIGRKVSVDPLGRVRPARD
jgi:CRISPR-associated endonuclease Csn1